MAEAAAPAILLELEKLGEKCKQISELYRRVRELASKTVSIPAFSDLPPIGEVEVTYKDVDLEPPLACVILNIELARINEVTFRLHGGKMGMEVTFTGLMRKLKEDKATIHLSSVASLSALLIFTELVEKLRAKGLNPIGDLEERLKEKESTLQTLETMLKRLSVILTLAS